VFPRKLLYAGRTKFKMELDLDRGTLTVYIVGESLFQGLGEEGYHTKIGVLATGLTGPLCWMVEMTHNPHDGRDQASIKTAPNAAEMDQSRLEVCDRRQDLVQKRLD